MSAWSNFRNWVSNRQQREPSTPEPITINLNITLGGTLRIIHETAEPPPKPKQLPGPGKLKSTFSGEISGMAKNGYVITPANAPSSDVQVVRLRVFDGVLQELEFLPTDSFAIVVDQDTSVTVELTYHSDDPNFTDSVTRSLTFTSSDRDPPTAVPLPDPGELSATFTGEVK